MTKHTSSLNAFSPVTTEEVKSAASWYYPMYHTSSDWYSEENENHYSNHYQIIVEAFTRLVPKIGKEKVQILLRSILKQDRQAIADYLYKEFKFNLENLDYISLVKNRKLPELRAIVNNILDEIRENTFVSSQDKVFDVDSVINEVSAQAMIQQTKKDSDEIKDKNAKRKKCWDVYFNNNRPEIPAQTSFLAHEILEGERRGEIQGVIRKAGRRKGLDNESCEDLIQEVAIKCQFHPSICFDERKGSVIGYLKRIAERAASDMQEKNHLRTMFKDFVLETSLEDVKISA